MNLNSQLHIELKQATHTDFCGDEDPVLLSTTMEVDVTTATASQWLGIIERLLLVAGYSEYEILSAACEMAFNSSRPKDTMKSLYKFYELEEFSAQPNESHDATT